MKPGWWLPTVTSYQRSVTYYVILNASLSSWEFLQFVFRNRLGLSQPAQVVPQQCRALFPTLHEPVTAFYIPRGIPYSMPRKKSRKTKQVSTQRSNNTLRLEDAASETTGEYSSLALLDPHSYHSGVVVEPSTYPSLPTEVLFEIVSYLKHDPRSLRFCSLISSEWLSVARNFLFREISLHLKELGHFFHLIKSPTCTLSHHVRMLQLRGSRYIPNDKDLSSVGASVWEAGEFKSNMGKIPQLLPNVDRLCLIAFPLGCMTPLLRRKFYAGFEKVETLVLKGDPDPIAEYGPRHLKELFASFPRIRKLECGDIPLGLENTPGVGEAEQGSSSPLLLPDLTELLLNNLSRPALEFIHTRMAVQNVQRLTLNLTKREQVEPGGVIDSMLQEIGPRLVYLVLALNDETSSQTGENSISFSGHMYSNKLRQISGNSSPT